MSRVKHIACPECKKLGKDNHGDNLAVYPDGGQFCFSCGYSTTSKRYVPELPSHAVRSTFPVCGIPPLASKWLANFLTEEEVKRHFVYDSELGRLALRDTLPKFYWGRSLNTMKGVPKVFTSGTIPYHIFGGKGDTLVIVEDPISALVVSRCYAALPLFGSYFHKDWYPLLTRSGYKNIVVWLDNDKAYDSVKLALNLRHLFNTKYVITDLDPKYYSKELVELYVSQELAVA